MELKSSSDSVIMRILPWTEPGSSPTYVGKEAINLVLVHFHVHVVKPPPKKVKVLNTYVNGIYQAANQ